MFATQKLARLQINHYIDCTVFFSLCCGSNASSSTCASSRKNAAIDFKLIMEQRESSTPKASIKAWCKWHSAQCILTTISGQISSDTQCCVRICNRLPNGSCLLVFISLFISHTIQYNRTARVDNIFIKKRKSLFRLLAIYLSLNDQRFSVCLI